MLFTFCRQNYYRRTWIEKNRIIFTWSSLPLSENFSEEEVSGELCWARRTSSLKGKEFAEKKFEFFGDGKPGKPRLTFDDLEFELEVRLAIEYSVLFGEVRVCSEFGIRVNGGERFESWWGGGAGGAKNGKEWWGDGKGRCKDPWPEINKQNDYWRFCCWSM